MSTVMAGTPLVPAFESSVFFIPTNRDCSRAVGSYLQELDYARRRFDRAIPLVVSETDQGPHVAANAEALRSAAREHPEIASFHLTVPRQRTYFDVLLSGEPAVVNELFRSERRDYGTAMNKLFLMSCSFGADALHRRDSDTRLLSDELPEDAGRFPIEIELTNLGQRVSQVRASQRSLVDPDAEDPEVCIVGGNYYGEWNLDVKDFTHCSYEIVERLYVLLGFDPDTVPELCREIFPHEQTYLAADELTLVAKVNDGPNADCGNVAITKIHELLPNVPGRNMLAADYFTFDLATSLGIPSLHHTRAVFHEYTSIRFEYESKLRYWEGVARFADYFNLYMPMFDHHALGSADAAATPISGDVVSRVRHAVATLPDIDPEPRRARIEAIAREILLPFDERYARIGEHLIGNADRYVTESNEDYRNHQVLLERWRSLIERAKNIDLPALLAGE